MCASARTGALNRFFVSSFFSLPHSLFHFVRVIAREKHKRGKKVKERAMIWGGLGFLGAELIEKKTVVDELAQNQ